MPTAGTCRSVSAETAAGSRRRRSRRPRGRRGGPRPCPRPARSCRALRSRCATAPARAARGCSSQIATASASAAWSGEGTSDRPSRRATIRPTWSLPARPWPQTAPLTCCGVYERDGHAALAGGQQHHAARLADRERGPRVGAEVQLLDRERVRPVAVEQLAHVAVDLGQPALERSAGAASRSRRRASARSARARALDHAVAGARGAGVDSEDDHRDHHSASAARTPPRHDAIASAAVARYAAGRAGRRSALLGDDLGAQVDALVADRDRRRRPGDDRRDLACAASRRTSSESSRPTAWDPGVRHAALPRQPGLASEHCGRAIAATCHVGIAAAVHVRGAAAGAAISARRSGSPSSGRSSGTPSTPRPGRSAAAG